MAMKKMLNNFTVVFSSKNQMRKPQEKRFDYFFVNTTGKNVFNPLKTYSAGK